ncbi:MAG: T9SS type A sorting domain-containing protein [Lentimicrobium sp.]|nr:T9SS type A sorting domain-containing protein [Lentimicrobium sp.]
MKKLFTIIFLMVLSGLLYSQEWISITGESSSEPRVTIENLPSVGLSASISIEGFWKQEVSTPAGIMNRIVVVDGTAQTEAGFPDVQHLTVSLMIPETGNFSINVLRADYTDYSDIVVAPSKGDPQFSDLPGWGSLVYNKDLLTNNDFYPAAIAEAGQPYIWCDTRGMALQVYPFAYNPVSGILRVYHNIEINLQVDAEPGTNELVRYSGSYGRLSGLSTLKQSHFINYSESSRYQPVEEAGNMLIVAPENYRTTLQPFIDWKTRCGIVCEFADVSAFQSADQIRQFVSERYYSQGLAYLILAGDAAQVPTNQAENGASDNMYGYIAGDDHYPEVLVGRFSAENVNQLAIMVKRSIEYEMLGKGNNAYSNFLGIASEEGPGDDGELDFEHMRNIGKLLQTYNYSNFAEMYDGSQGEADAAGNPNSGMVEAAINNGQGAVMYIGHGSSGAWTTSAFSGDKVAALSNTETHPFIWAAGCSSGDFVTTTCLAERWLRAEKNGVPTGAVAVMMSTSRQSWYPPMEAQDEMALILARKKESVTTRTFGGISMSGCMRMNDKYGPGGFKVTDTWNIFGDPSVVVRTALPMEMQALHSSTLGTDAREFVVKLNVSEALACITYNGKLYGAGRVQDGTAIINLDEIPETGVMQLTITAYNYRPYTADIEITKMPSVAFNPEPVNYAGKISPYTLLRWKTKDGMEPAFFEILISENPDMSNPISTMVSFTNEIRPQFPLAYATTCYWKVISYNEFGSSESRVFNFNTANPPDEDFESQGFPRSNWLNTDDSPWFIDGETSFEGNYSLRSGIIDDLGSSRLAYSCYSHSCDYISFRVKISSQTNADFLRLVINGNTVATYSGEFDWTEEKFPIDPGEHLIEWIYSKNESESHGMDAVWIDNIYLPGNLDPVVIIDDFETCQGYDVELSIQTTGSSRVEWLSEGSGIFDDYNSHFPVYIPSKEDKARGYVILFTDVFGNDFCDPVRYETTVTLLALPELPAINDTVLYAGEEIEIVLPIAVNADYKLHPCGNSGSVFTIKADELNEGENILTIACENEGGCFVETSFTVTVIKAIRPLAGKELLIYPNPAVDQISFATTIQDNGKISVKMFNISGQLVVQSDKDNAYGNPLDISGLPGGIYMVRIENGEEVQNGRFIKMM